MTLDAAAAAHPFLKGFKPEHIQVLLANALPVNFQAGEVLFREGEAANRFYLIYDGAVVLESYLKDSGSSFVEKIGGGGVIGWSWLFPPYYWRMDARAVEPTKAIFFYGARLRQEAEQDFELGYELMKRVAAIAIERLEAARGFPIDAPASL